MKLTGENLPEGFKLIVDMEKRNDTWHILSVGNVEDYVKAVKAGRKAAALHYIEQEQAVIKKYNESIKALKEKYQVLTTEYADGYEAAEKELSAGYAAIQVPEVAEMLAELRQKRIELAAEHIRLIRAYVAGDKSDDAKQKRKDIEDQISQNAEEIRSTIKQIKQ